MTLLRQILPKIDKTLDMFYWNLGQQIHIHALWPTHLLTRLFARISDCCTIFNQEAVCGAAPKRYHGCAFPGNNVCIYTTRAVQRQP